MDSLRSPGAGRAVEASHQVGILPTSESLDTGLGHLQPGLLRQLMRHHFPRTHVSLIVAAGELGDPELPPAPALGRAPPSEEAPSSRPIPRLRGSRLLLPPFRCSLSCFRETGIFQLAAERIGCGKREEVLLPSTTST
jgi:hypothetical protein